MTRRDRLRRVLLLCLHCLRNLAYRRAGWHAGRLRLNDSQFWRTVNGNFLDVCVLEWCKVFGSKRDPHCWRNFVSDPSGFKTDLLRHLSLDEAEFEKYVQHVLVYRNKFIAHLDSERVMNIPKLDIIKESTCFYLNYVVTKESQTGDLSGYEPYTDPNRYYEQCADEAEQQYNLRSS